MSNIIRNIHKNKYKKLYLGTLLMLCTMGVIEADRYGRDVGIGVGVGVGTGLVVGAASAGVARRHERRERRRYRHSRHNRHSRHSMERENEELRRENEYLRRGGY
jgi:hypothetical protein